MDRALRRPAASHPVPPATPTNPEPPSGGEEPQVRQNQSHQPHSAPGLASIPSGSMAWG
jgi:hypothetical protein